MKTRYMRIVATSTSHGRSTGNRSSKQRVWFMGPVSLFIAVMVLFCLICLVYLWEDSTITTANARIAQLLQTRANVEQIQQTLSLQALTLQSQQRIQIEAIEHDHLQLAQDSQVQWIPAAVVAPALAAARASEQRAAAHTSLAATGIGGRATALANNAPSAWWQAASHALAALFR
jgi:hypothetical protein